jgi:hypothetical protein
MSKPTALLTASIRTRVHNIMRNYAQGACALLLALACKPSEPPTNTGGSGGEKSGAAGGSPSAGGAANAAGAEPSGGSLPTPVPKYHPPPGFEDCTHAEVKTDCTDGWCKLAPSCFVMGSPENEWHRGRDSENQTAVNLTHTLEMQQKELSRSEWETITKTLAPGPDNCTEGGCPVALVSWWDAVHAADLLSTQKKLEPCYEPVDCTGILGKDLVCTGVKDPDKSVYECQGYRLPTRSEAEYAARAAPRSCPRPPSQGSVVLGLPRSPNRRSPESSCPGVEACAPVLPIPAGWASHPHQDRMGSHCVSTALRRS